MSEPTTLTLPGPTVTRAVTWDAVRAYLRAEGWTYCDRNVWEPPGPYVASTAVRASGDIDDLSFAVRRLARLANVSPGEMLARIADGANPTAPTVDPRWYDARSGAHCLNYMPTYTAAARVIEHGPGDVRWYTYQPDGCPLNAGTRTKVGEGMAAAEASLARVRP